MCGASKKEEMKVPNLLDQVEIESIEVALQYDVLFQKEEIYF